jgi:REP element-mobilizing transposase RayT
MARPLRIEYEGAFYHVTARGNEKKRIFFSKSDCLRFKEYLKEAQKKYGYQLHCYALMTNHYHLLLETPEANLAKVMHYVNASYTGYVNRRRRRSGHLFQGRYKAILIDRDRYLLELSRYVHLNPVRAKVAAKPEDYPYTSYRSYISKAEDSIVYRDLILGMISKDRKRAPIRYRAFVEGTTRKDFENPLKDVYGGMILGSPGFIKQVLRQLKDRIVHREDISHGRELQTVASSDDILMGLCEYFGVSRADVFGKRNNYKRMAIYLLKRNTGLTNRQIGQMFGDMSYSAVTKAYQRFSAELKKNRRLRKDLQEILAVLSKVKT